MADDADRIAALEQRVAALEARMPSLPMAPAGCVCPIGAEASCQGLCCPRRHPLQSVYVRTRRTYSTGGDHGR